MTRFFIDSRHLFARRALALSSLIACMVSTPAAPPSDAPLSGLAGAEFDFTIGNLDKDSSVVRYGWLSLGNDGRVTGKGWSTDARQPIPARLGTGRYSPSVQPQGRLRDSDRGARVLSSPEAFNGPPRDVSGRWWTAAGGVCLSLGEAPAVLLKDIDLSADRRRWGHVLRSERAADVCAATPDAHSVQAAPRSTVGVLSERVFPRTNPDLKLKYQKFEGLISRLNGWDARCTLTTWDQTSLNFMPGTFEAVGHDVWRAITKEHQQRGPDMEVFAYLALPDQMTPAGRIVLMNVGHDFNRNGRIDDDWGHIYAGFPVVSRAGDVGGFMLVDMSPVGIREAPYTEGCRAAGVQVTRTLGLILYLSDELGPRLNH